MTPLLPFILEEIAAHGPLRLDRYMALALGHPVHGYYSARDPFGPQGDFTTAPETSQLFGELTALHLYDAWERMGAPAEVTLLECGPGRGTLIADILRSLTRLLQGKTAPFPFKPLLLETSRLLRQKQEAALAPFPCEARWIEELTVPEMPLLVVANEFLDALPVRQFRFLEGIWKERHVTAPTTDLIWLDIPCGPPPSAPAPQEGMIYEYCLEAHRILTQLTVHAGHYPTSALWIDYGYEKGEGDSLQAVKQHHYVDPLAEPGLADLTCHVDFGRLRHSAGQMGWQGNYLLPQGEFLRRLGIEQRLATLLQRATPEQKDSVTQGYWRLTSPAAMGTLFKVWCMESRHLSPFPAAFSIEAAQQVP